VELAPFDLGDVVVKRHAAVDHHGCAFLEVFAAHGLPSSLYTDRGSHYFHTPQADGPVDRARLTQVGRGLKHHFFTGRGAGSTNAVGMSARSPDRIGTTSRRRTTWT
jgi:hypothetical protein